MRMNLLRQRLRCLIKFVSCHNQKKHNKNEAYIKHAITKEYIIKVLKCVVIANKRKQNQRRTNANEFAKTALAGSYQICERS